MLEAAPDLAAESRAEVPADLSRPTILADATRAAVGLWSFWRAERRQWADPAALRRWQARRLARLVQHAYATVPFYRRLYDCEGVDVSAVRSLDDAARLPVVTKAQLQAQPLDDLLSSMHRRETLVFTNTSGSSGRPFRAYRNRTLEYWRAGLLLRVLATAGYRPGDRLLMVVESGERPGTGWTRWRKLTYHDRPELVLAELERLRPAIVYGYVSALRQVVRCARELGRGVPRPKAVVTVSETLDPATRRMLADGFAAPVFDLYGSVEMGVIAWECPAHDGYHLAEDSLLVETRPEATGGERLLITNLRNGAMPLIRYDQGDFALPHQGGACPCGRRLRRLDAIQGRVMDVIVRPDGGEVPPFRITGAVSEVPGVRRFQIVQDRADRLTARVESAVPLGEEFRTRVERALRPVLGPAMRIAIEGVATLEPPPGVKFRIVESRLGPPERA
jgi:phenylacetate-CoA ligase